jgi:tetratricopeptide (TPR) repeat protein
MAASDLAALLERGIAQQGAGQHKAAVQIFRMVVKRGGGDAMIQYRLGLSLEAIGDYARADEAYRAAMQRDPDLYPAYRRASAMALVGCELATRAGNQAAAESFRRGAGGYLALLGLRLKQRGAVAEAGAILAQARALAPDLPLTDGKPQAESEAPAAPDEEEGSGAG